MTNERKTAAATDEAAAEEARAAGSEPAPEMEAPPAEGDASAPAEAEPGPEVEAEPPVEPDYKDQWLRAAADLENVRKRARRDVAAAEARGIARVVRGLLPALDNLERALAAAEDQPENRDHHLTDGIRLVQKELLGALTRVGIEPYSPLGETFDPHRHEAVAQQPVDAAESGTIVEVYQSGYRFGEDVLRAAKVVVAA
ncbi:MAG: nucleotide exchange factor GrpE [Solirubrobacterales bacterium]|jgi:molecular chaperone GrpE|nr:nucleotide exchange factor GrpE [Solirubrobacterales bacterium]